MKRTKTQKGITLIALIITVIILLILAVVAIGAVQNDGIIQHAKNARDEYSNAQTNEDTLLGEYLAKLEENDPAREEINLLEKYVLGVEKQGRSVPEIIDLGTMKFINEESTIKEASTEITYFDSTVDKDYPDHSKGFLYAKYNNKVYKIVYDYYTGITESIEEVYAPEGREGAKVKYDSNGDGTLEDWVVLTDRDGKLEIVSVNAMFDKDGNGLKLGAYDTGITVTEDLDGNGTKGDPIDIAIASYNNAIKSINDFCNEVVTATDNEGVRSIGESADTAGDYGSTNFNSWFKGTTSVKAEGSIEIPFTFESDPREGEYKPVGIDYLKMHYFGMENASERAYWTCTRFVLESRSFIYNYDNIYFGLLVNLAKQGSGYMPLELLRIFETGVDGGPSGSVPATWGVLPVVINPSNIQFVD